MKMIVNTMIKKIDGIEYWVVKGQKYKIIYPDDETRKIVSNIHEFNQSIEGQAVHIIYEKYKRTHNLEYSLMKRLVKIISDERRPKKEPNVDFLTQKLSEFVRNHCPLIIIDDEI